MLFRSEALGRPEGTIKAQVSRGLDRLRELLAASIEPSTRPSGPRDTGRSQATSISSSFPDVIGGRFVAAAEVLS